MISHQFFYQLTVLLPISLQPSKEAVIAHWMDKA